MCLKFKRNLKYLVLSQITTILMEFVIMLQVNQPYHPIAKEAEGYHKSLKYQEIVGLLTLLESKEQINIDVLDTYNKFTRKLSKSTSKDVRKGI